MEKWQKASRYLKRMHSYTYRDLDINLRMHLYLINIYYIIIGMCITINVYEIKIYDMHNTYITSDSVTASLSNLSFPI